MFAETNGTRGDRTEVERERFRPQGRQVRLVLFTWPVIALVGATVATATCLLNKCDGIMKSTVRETLVGNVGSVKSIAIRPDGAMLSSVGLGGELVTFDLTERPTYPYVLPETGLVRCAAFSPDNRLVATACSSQIVALHDLDNDTRRPIDDITGASTDAACLAFSPDGTTLAVGQEDGKVTLWNVASGKHRGTLSGHAFFVATLVYTQDGATLASSGRDHQARIWDVASRRQKLAIRGPENTFVAMVFSRDGSRLYLADHVRPTVRVWDVKNELELDALSGPSSAVIALQISPDGATLAAGDFKGVVTLWNLATARVRTGPIKHAGVRSLAFTPDSFALATGGFDGTIRFWDVRTVSED